MLASCGDDEGESARDDPESAPETVVCQAPPPTEIGFGSTTSGEILGDTKCFSMEVPGGEAVLMIELTDMTGALDLSVGYGDVETMLFHTGDFWESVEAGTADEVVVIDAPRPGTYYVAVSPATFRDISSFTLRVGS